MAEVTYIITTRLHLLGAEALRILGSHGEETKLTLPLIMNYVDLLHLNNDREKIPLKYFITLLRPQP